MLDFTQYIVSIFTNPLIFVLTKNRVYKSISMKLHYALVKRFSFHFHENVQHEQHEVRIRSVQDLIFPSRLMEAFSLSMISDDLSKKFAWFVKYLWSWCVHKGGPQYNPPPHPCPVVGLASLMFNEPFFHIYLLVTKSESLYDDL